MCLFVEKSEIRTNMKKKHTELSALTLREKNLQEHFSLFLSKD